MYRKARHAGGKREIASVFMDDLQEQPGAFPPVLCMEKHVQKNLAFPNREDVPAHVLWDVAMLACFLDGMWLVLP